MARTKVPMHVVPTYLPPEKLKRSHILILSMISGPLGFKSLQLQSESESEVMNTVLDVSSRWPADPEMVVLHAGKEKGHVLLKGFFASHHVKIDEIPHVHESSIVLFKSVGADVAFSLSRIQ